MLSSIYPIEEAMERRIIATSWMPSAKSTAGPVPTVERFVFWKARQFNLAREPVCSADVHRVITVIWCAV